MTQRWTRVPTGEIESVGHAAEGLVYQLARVDQSIAARLAELTADIEFRLVEAERSSTALAVPAGVGSRPGLHALRPQLPPAPPKRPSGVWLSRPVRSRTAAPDGDRLGDDTQPSLVPEDVESVPGPPTRRGHLSTVLISAGALLITLALVLAL